MPINISIQGGEQFARKGEALLGASLRLADRLQMEANAFALNAVRRVQGAYLSGPRPGKLGVISGRLRASITPEVRREGNNLVIRVGTNVTYAAIHELGGQTPPHEIRPKNGLALRFVTPGFSGAIVTTKSGKFARRQAPGAFTFAQVVHHPGSKIPARPFLAPGVKDELPAFEARIRAVMMGVARGE